jgi:UDP-glucose 4-epimerase
VKALVTGSAGDLGEALVHTLQHRREEVVGLDILDSPFTTIVGSIVDRACVRRSMREAQGVYHTATLRKPNVSTKTSGVRSPAWAARKVTTPNGLTKACTR